MATVGNTDITGWTDTTNCEGTYRALSITMSEAGTVDSVTAYVAETTTSNAHSVWALIYDNSGNLVDTSSCRTDITTTAQWYTWTGFSGASLSASASYYLCLAFGTGSGNISFLYSGTGGYRQTAPGSTPPSSCAAFSPDDPVTLEGSNNWAIYLTYTPAAVDVDVTPTVKGSSVTPQTGLSVGVVTDVLASVKYTDVTAIAPTLLLDILAYPAVAYSSSASQSPALSVDSAVLAVLANISTYSYPPAIEGGIVRIGGMTSRHVIYYDDSVERREEMMRKRRRLIAFLNMQEYM